MRLRRRQHLVCHWTTDGFLVGVPGHNRWVRIPHAVVGLLDRARDWIDLTDLVAAVDPERPEEIGRAVRGLAEVGVLVTDETGADSTDGTDGAPATADAQDRIPPLWQHWGSVTQRFHLSTRDANYLVDTPERARVAEAIVAEGGAPPIFKEYPDHPVVMLPRRPLPLRAPVEDVFAARRTHRVFADTPVTLDQLATVLFHTFAPQRFLDGRLFGVQQGRVSASAGGRHEVECYLVAHQVEGVPPGLYHYAPRQHALELLREDVDRAHVADLSYHQGPSYQGAFTIFTTAVARRLSWKYRHPRAYRLWMYDAGHYGQTYALTCTALGLGPFQTVAFRDSAVERLLGVDPDEEFAVYLLAAGVPAHGPAPVPADLDHPPPAHVR
ncbi:SagB/ThcOx family dehydrogenase [Streptoalloteichus hindustanus]|uniref:SagB-type dehydrogenase domain-containing protein n=1 Tax=Streptoalloteichus hindustanus TaxID=2017 RepID=A0A1M5LBY5_STRHI|nr:SagB/ThcOx family dehydrogenase [Streptoalloteichus hindustanus]SHG61933.1 SagB-type dehydrogenase domain-containing protein [Streptoalloteichus hindustanus]